MKKTIILMTALAVTGMTALAQEVVPADSVAAAGEKVVSLGELTVTGASVVNKSDRKWIIPSDKSKDMAADGCDLVKKLQMPDVKVDAVSGAISMFSNGKMKLCINGRPVQDKDIRAIDPKTVTRVEYHDNPSLRFGEADLVLDFIVKVPQSGGRFGIMGQVVPLKGLEYQFNPDLEINYKKSTFRVNGYNERLNGFEQWRENYENYTLADGSKFTRTESGVPADLNHVPYWGSVEYMYYEPEKDLLSVSAFINGNRSPHQDFVGTLTSTLDDSKVLLRDLTYKSSYAPSLSAYYQHNFAKNKLLMMYVVAGINRSRTYRDYTEQDIVADGDGDMLVDVKNDIRSRSKSLMAEIDYEQSWRRSRLSVGGSFQYDWSKIRYLSYDKMERMRNSSTYLYSQWWQSLGSHFDATIGVGAYMKYYSVSEGEDVSRWTFAPRLSLRYRINGKNTLRLNYMLRSVAPTLTQLSSVRQQVDGLQQSVGNASLKTYSAQFVKLSYEYSHKRFYGQLELGYAYSGKPIGQQKDWVDGAVLSTYANQRDFQDIIARGTLRYEVIPDWVSASGSLTWRRMMSHGNNYNHTLSSIYANASVEVSHWNFGFDFQVNARRKSLDGEIVNQEDGNNGIILALTYKWRKFQFMTGCLNPFTGDYKEESKNLNALAGYRRVAHLDFLSRCLIFRVYYNISWGRQYKSGDRRINNSLERGGVSAAGK